MVEQTVKISLCCDAGMGCQVGKKCMLPFTPTSAGGFIGPLKWINHFPLTGLSTSHPLSPHFGFGFYSQTVYTNCEGCGMCVDCVHITTQNTCATQVCINPQSMIMHAYNTCPADRVCVEAHGCMCLAGQSSNSTGCFSCSLSLVL